MNFKEFADVISDYPTNKIVFVGLGNSIRGDDGAGLIFLDNLQKTEKFKNTRFINAGTNPENYLQEILSYQPKLVLFIDTSRWGGKPGEMSFLDDEKIEMICLSTHTFSIRIIAQYLKSSQPMDVKYFVIQPELTGIAATLSYIVNKKMVEFFNSQFIHEY